MSRLTRSLLLIALFVLLVAGGAAGEGGGPEPALRRLEATTVKVATRGHREAVDALVEALKGLGRDAKAVDRLRKRLDKALAATKGKRRPVPRETKILRQTAAEIAAALDGMPEAERAAMARAILRIDGSIESAHAVLGHVRHGDRWVSARLAPVLDRRAQLREVAQKAQRLEFELTEKKSQLPGVVAAAGAPGHSVHWKTISVHSASLEPERLRRILTGALRAWTFANYLETGKLEPPQPRTVKMVLLRSRAEYLKAAKEALANGGLEEKHTTAALEHWGIYKDARGFQLSWNAFEPRHQAVVLRELWWWQHFILTHGTSAEPLQPCLHKGHLNWLCHTFLGAEVPGWGFVDLLDEPPSRDTSDTPLEAARREELLRFAKAGIAGIREYLMYLARRGEDPAFARSIVDRSGKLAGEALLKATLVVEYLHDTGEFQKLLEATARQPSSGETFSAALGESLAAFEDRWKEWLLVDDVERSAVQLLESGAGPAALASPPALAHLNALRGAALVDPPEVGLEPGLSGACSKHARYLIANPDQQGAWPDCHEEYADRPGFSPAGAWAGGNSVIFCGVEGGEEAVDGWMATFYHRLPLLHPGLLSIGWAYEERVAVLDAGSLVEYAWSTPVAVGWPAPGARDVARRFAPEMPNPVPGEDQSAWGYPITLQFFGERAEHVDVTLRLYAGTPIPANEVACHFSTPDRPTNSLVSPQNAFCLIPKAHLKPRTRYHVVVEGLPADVTGAIRTGWTFNTSK